MSSAPKRGHDDRDASVNRDAPVICCTAEILATSRSAAGRDADVDYVVMDEFHYFSDRDRGSLANSVAHAAAGTLLLDERTLGDMSAFEAQLTQLTGARTVTIKSAERPVPLEYEYQELHLHDAVKKLNDGGRAPVYVVSFAQRAAAEVAQDLMSLDFCTKEEK